jgi:general secretion pathway protein D
VGAVGALPAANTQFSFQDVGVTLEITPSVHDNNEISMILDLDVSQVLDRINVGGVSEPEIADNKVTANIRMREGEVNLIGGIIQDTNTKSIAGVPGLAHLPIIGRIFSNEDSEKTKTELVIALIPHIIRGPDITASNLKGVSAGTSAQIKVSYDDGAGTAASRISAMPSGTPTPVPAAAASVPAGPPSTAPPATAPPSTAPPSTAPPATAPPATAPPATAPPATAPPPTAPAPGRVSLGVPGVSAPVMTPPAPGAPAPGAPAAAKSGAARVTIQPSVATSTLNSAITMTISAENVVDLADVSTQIQYDPKILRVTNIVAGELPGRNLAPLELSKTVMDDVGRADMRLSRGSAGGTISGSGSLFTVVFQAIGRGNASVTLSSVGIRNADGPLTATTSAPAAVNVK